MAKVIAIANQKGGVGKTTTAVNLSAAIGLLNKKVLIIDCDPQGNASSGLGYKEGSIEKELYNSLVEGIPLNDVILKTESPNLDLVPSTVDLVGAEIELVGLQEREFQMKKVIAQITDKYDYIFIDCLPSLGILTLNALTAADAVIIPIQCEVYSLEGLGKLKQTINIVKESLNPELEIEGVLLSMYDKRLRLANMLESQIREILDDRIFDTVIHRNSKVAEAPSMGKPVMLYEVSSTGSKNFLNLANEVLQINNDSIVHPKHISSDNL